MARDQGVSCPCSLCFTPLTDAGSTEHLSTMPKAAPTFVTYIRCAVWMLDAVPHISLSRTLKFYSTTYVFSVTRNLMHGWYQITVTVVLGGYGSLAPSPVCMVRSSSMRFGFDFTWSQNQAPVGFERTAVSLHPMEALRFRLQRLPFPPLFHEGIRMIYAGLVLELVARHPQRNVSKSEDDAS